MKIIPLSEGTFTIDKTKQFVPFQKGADNLQERAIGSLLVEIQPFIVITNRDILLLDTGLGFEQDGVLQLHRNIQAAGINTSDVTKVLLSHLHKDHAGGLGEEFGGLKRSLSFPNARYYLQQKELAFAYETGEPSFSTQDLAFLQNNSQVELLNGNGFIDDYIQYEITAGHSPFHQAFWIREGGETIFYGADEAPQLQQMKHRFVAKYDADGKRAMQLRQQWWQQGEEEGWTFLFYHDVKNPTWKFAN